jgi:RNA-directed DNA polymerase
MGKAIRKTDGTTFIFLGFCHVWGKSRKGKNVVRQVTAKKRYARALAAVADCCRQHRHLPIPEQHTHLSAMMQGHYAYYRITGNSRRLSWYACKVTRIWQTWLSGRVSNGNWAQFQALLARHPLPTARVVHR